MIMNILDNIVLAMFATYSTMVELGKYLLSKPRPKETPWPRLIICRWRGHPAGVWYVNANGLEPDMHCKHCGEDLG
jgi:hypothetical protein